LVIIKSKWFRETDFIFTKISFVEKKKIPAIIPLLKVNYYLPLKAI